MKLIGEGWEIEAERHREDGRMHVAVRDSDGQEYEFNGLWREREPMWRAFMVLIASGKLRDPAAVAHLALEAARAFDRLMDLSESSHA